MFLAPSLVSLLRWNDVLLSADVFTFYDMAFYDGNTFQLIRFWMLSLNVIRFIKVVENVRQLMIETNIIFFLCESNELILFPCDNKPLTIRFE